MQREASLSSDYLRESDSVNQLVLQSAIKIPQIFLTIIRFRFDSTRRRRGEGRAGFASAAGRDEAGEASHPDCTKRRLFRFPLVARFLIPAKGPLREGRYLVPISDSIENLIIIPFLLLLLSAVPFLTSLSPSPARLCCCSCPFPWQ